MTLPWNPRVATCAGALLWSALAGCAPAIEPPPVQPPTLEPIPSPTALDEVVLRGTKPAGTAIVAGTNQRLVPLDGETTFLTTFTLTNEGVNEISVSAVDGDGLRSDPVRLEVVRDTTPPGPPTVDVPERPTFQTTWTLTGRGDAAATVLVNGEPADQRDGEAWVHELELELGDNPVRVSAVDNVGNESQVVEVSLLRTTYSFSVDPWPALVSAAQVEITGDRGPGVAVVVDGEEEVPPTVTGGPWTATLDVPADATTSFAVVGEHPENSETVTVTLERDATAPSVPVLDAVPTLVEAWELPLTGTADADAAIEVNGLEVAPADAAAAFSALVGLAPGENTLEVRAVDAAGNRSAPVTPAPVVYAAPAGLVFTVDPVPTETDAAMLTVSGTRSPDLEIRVEGSVVAAPDTGATWSGMVTLAAGENVLTVEASVADHVETRMVTVFSLPAAPAAPVLTSPAYANDTTVTVTGTREPTAAVRRADGSPVAPRDGGTAFTDERTLAVGDNTVSYVAVDAFGRTSPPGTANVFVDLTAPAVTIDQPASGAVAGASLALSGDATDAEGVDRVEVCAGDCLVDGDWSPAAGSQPWTATLDLSSLPGDEFTPATVRARAFDLAGNETATSIDVRLARTPVALSAAAGFSEPSAEADLDVYGGGLMVGVFSHDDGGGSEIWLRGSQPTMLDAAETLVSGHASLDASTQPRVRWAGGMAQVVFCDDGAAGTTGSPGLVHVELDGTTDPAPTVLQALGGVSDPQLSANSSGDLAAVWTRDTGGGATRVEISLRDGDTGTWSGPLVVADDADADSSAPQRPAVSFDDDRGTVHIVWEDAGDLDGTADDVDIYHRVLTAPSTLSAKAVVSTDDGALVDGDSRRPQIVALPLDADRGAWVGWIEGGAIDGADAGLAKAAVAFVDDNGIGAAEDASLVTGRGAADDLALALGPTGDLVVAWTDRGDVLGTGTDADVFVVRRTDTWGTVRAVSDLDDNATSTGESRLPRVRVDTLDQPHFSWIEESDLAGTIADAADRDALYFALGVSP